MTMCTETDELKVHWVGPGESTGKASTEKLESRKYQNDTLLIILNFDNSDWSINITNGREIQQAEQNNCTYALVLSVSTCMLPCF